MNEKTKSTTRILYLGERTKLDLLKCLLGFHYWEGRKPINLAREGEREFWHLHEHCSLCGATRVIG